MFSNFICVLCFYIAFGIDCWEKKYDNERIRNLNAGAMMVLITTNFFTWGKIFKGKKNG